MMLLLYGKEGPYFKGQWSQFSHTGPMNSDFLSSLSDEIAAAYNINPISIVPGPRGFVGDTYIVELATGQRLFAKLIAAKWHDSVLAQRMVVLAELQALGLSTVVAPIRAASGRLTGEWREQTLMLFPYIVGQSSAQVPFEFDRFVALLAAVHAMSPTVKTEIPQEDFALPWSAHLEVLLQQAFTEPRATAAQAQLGTLLQRYESQVWFDWTALKEMAQRCRNAGWQAVITHGDAPGDNTLIGDDGTIYLIDWDTMLLAPPERDGWFHLVNKETEANFLRVYCQTFPYYTPNPLFVRFYLFRRFFEDLYGYLVEIAESTSVAHQEKNLRELEHTCFGWLWPVIHAPD
jgi:thiamine kinase-like enzyme